VTSARRSHQSEALRASAETGACEGEMLSVSYCGRVLGCVKLEKAAQDRWAGDGGARMKWRSAVGAGGRATDAEGAVEGWRAADAGTPLGYKGGRRMTGVCVRDESFAGTRAVARQAAAGWRQRLGKRTGAESGGGRSETLQAQCGWAAHAQTRP
jgi:hypothetical protein